MTTRPKKKISNHSLDDIFFGLRADSLFSADFLVAPVFFFAADFFTARFVRGRPSFFFSRAVGFCPFCALLAISVSYQDFPLRLSVAGVDG